MIMNLDHLTKEEFYHDKDMTMLSCWLGENMYSVCNKRYSGDYLVQCTKLGLIFKTDDVNMAHKIMKAILVGGE